MKTTPSGVDLIKTHEGLRLSAYRCPAGILTIGYGHTGGDVTPGMSVTQMQAEILLVRDLARFETGVDRLVHVILTQNQFNALVSFAYNVGLGAFAGSTLLRKINANPVDPSIKDEFLRWNKAKGVILPGLTKRRMDEAILYFKR